MAPRRLLLPCGDLPFRDRRGGSGAGAGPGGPVGIHRRVGVRQRGHTSARGQGDRQLRDPDRRRPVAYTERGGRLSLAGAASPGCSRCGPARPEDEDRGGQGRAGWASARPSEVNLVHGGGERRRGGGGGRAGAAHQHQQGQRAGGVRPGHGGGPAPRQPGQRPLAGGQRCGGRHQRPHPRRRRQPDHLHAGRVRHPRAGAHAEGLGRLRGEHRRLRGGQPDGLGRLDQHGHQVRIQPPRVRVQRHRRHQLAALLHRQPGFTEADLPVLHQPAGVRARSSRTSSGSSSTPRSTSSRSGGTATSRGTSPTRPPTGSGCPRGPPSSPGR